MNSSNWGEEALKAVLNDAQLSDVDILDAVSNLVVQRYADPAYEVEFWQLNEGTLRGIPPFHLAAPRNKLLKHLQSKKALRSLATSIRAADRCASVIHMPPALSKHLPPALCRSIYVRKQYKALLNKIIALQQEAASRNSCAAVIVTGTPGVGKSAFALFYVCYLAQQRKKVVYRYTSDIEGDVVVIMDFGREPAHVEILKAVELAGRSSDLDAIHVYDSQAPAGQYSQSCHVVVLSSPNTDRWDGFHKGGGVHVVYMDIWSLRAILRCRELLYNNVPMATAVERYQQFGGSVRWVLANIEYTFDMLTRGIDADQALQMSKLYLAGTRNSVSHRIAHIRAGPELEFKYYVLASPQISTLVYKLAFQSNQQSIAQLLHGSVGQNMSGFPGMMWEQLCHSTVPKGLTRLRMRQLLAPSSKRSHDCLDTADERRVRSKGDTSAAGPSHGADDDFEAEAVIDSDDEVEDDSHHYDAVLSRPGGAVNLLADLRLAPDLATDSFASVSQRVDLASVEHTWDRQQPLVDLCNFYLQPQKLNNPAWDAYYSCSSSNNDNSSTSSGQHLILQYTVGDNHGVKARAIVRLLQRLPPSYLKDVRLVFVVPSEPTGKFEQFRWQSWLGVRGQVLKQVPKLVQNLQQWVIELPLLHARSKDSSKDSSKASSKSNSP